MKFRTFPNVTLFEAGVEYELSTGKTTFTPEDLRDAVSAATEDKAIPAPRLKLGHIDPRYNGPKYDGTPAFGKVVNLRLSSNGMAVLGDYIGVPEWLAEVLPVAYPSRSVEGFWNVTTATGKKWRFVLSAVSLLGVQWPGVSVIEDLPLYYGPEMPPDVEIAASQGGEGMKLPFRKTDAAANLDDVRRAFYQDYIKENSDASWWWIRAMLVDPNQLVVEDDETGQLFLLPFEADAKGVVSFGDAEPVRIDYVADDRDSQKAAAGHLAAALVSGRKAMATYASRAESRPADKGGRMDPKVIRQRLGLPEDASDEQVQEAIREINEAVAAPPPAPETPPVQPLPPVPKAEEPKEGGEEKPPATQEPPKEEPAATPIAAAAPPGAVLVDEATLAELRKGSETALRLERERHEESVTNLVAAAVNDGRIPPARREAWVDYLRSDFDGGKELLANLKPVLPLKELGITDSTIEGDPAGFDTIVREQWTPQLFPEVAARRQRETALASGNMRRSRIQREEGF